MNQVVDSTTTNSFLPMVSVVVPIYNGEGDLPELIKCLLSQTYPQERLEYLLVDNNSSDRTLSLLKEYTENNPVIHVLRENQIQSSYAARNIGIRAAGGEIVAFTDADCHPQPQWLHSLIQPFSDPSVVIVAGEITALPGNSILEKHAERQETLSQKHTLANSFCPYGQTANLAIRRIALQTAGLFRPYLTTGGDADICWRILRSNIGGLEFAPNAIIQHRHRGTLKELASQWRRYGRSNRYLHELHGVELMPEITAQYCSYRLARWFFKELPRDILRGMVGKATFVDLLNTPIGLFTARARFTGQRDAKLPENAKNIDWL
ncbi:glycosyltransferase family 2 protein [Umezakia ovalisporum]|jgi:glycosyltransferase involved in cell wall biosynthesis|uniref:Glycosyltransferase n=2 Tax=Umezakia ovalisporum TaxID=75695 RepID=A0AA43KDN9_9CYAN|nr:glycosyltransferase [Umezakia ovalisporum]MBI1241972.1 glycosyltransferase [Nostoc sp. RI_552]MDH6056780.1 glycosyltransferase [Umezakia ovalisporum FSS-43]MDH6062711.1 glycosyltransferase [Umezakia ovalisporum FSS-62]MDH6068154.1 glycosyltransferase [Umezakia ovalisporum APH033B]MDH6072195.1 glycosyltransferase [Umezakia ovalisporum CobakiLakeA]